MQKDLWVWCESSFHIGIFKWRTAIGVELSMKIHQSGTMGASTCDELGLLVGSTPQPRVDQAEGENGVATQIRSKNYIYIYSTLVEGLIFLIACV